MVSRVWKNWLGSAMPLAWMMALRAARHASAPASIGVLWAGRAEDHRVMHWDHASRAALGPAAWVQQTSIRSIGLDLHQAGSARGRQGRRRAHVLLMKPSPQHMAVLLPVWPFPSMRNSVVGLTCATQQRLSRRASAVHLGVWPPLITATAAGRFRMSAHESRGAAGEAPPHNALVNTF